MSTVDTLRNQYPDIRIVHGLPDMLPQQSDSCKAHSGYIGCVGGHGNQFALFFTDLEPALAFIQAGRTSIDATTIALVKAVDVRRFDPDRKTDVRTIYLGSHVNGIRGCKSLLQRWVEGVRSWSAHWVSPDGRTLTEADLRELAEECSAVADAEYSAKRTI